MKYQLQGGSKMRHFKGYCFLIVFALLLTGCAGEEKEKSPSNTKLTIESYNMSDKETLLISKTGVEQIGFFKLNGTLKEEDDLQFSVEVYEKGKFKEELLKTMGETEPKFKDTLISFGISDNGDEDNTIKLLNGVPSGLATTIYSNNMTGYSFTNLVDEKVTLEKNKPIYLAAWLGTTNYSLSSAIGGNGVLPSGIEESELGFIYKVLWTDKEKN